jgi:hypothetical protein
MSRASIHFRADGIYLFVLFVFLLIARGHTAAAVSCWVGGSFENSMAKLNRLKSLFNDCGCPDIDAILAEVDLSLADLSKFAGKRAPKKPRTDRPF